MMDNTPTATPFSQGLRELVVEDNGVEITAKDFMDFCTEFFMTGPEKFHPPSSGERHRHAVSAKLPFSRHQGLCFNFVSWLHFVKFGATEDFVPAHEPYVSTDGSNLYNLHFLSLSICEPFYRDYVRSTLTNEGYVPCDNPRASIVYPFGDGLEFYFHACYGKLYDDGARLDFCRLVGEFAGSNN